MALIKEHYHLSSPACLNNLTANDFICGCEFEIEDIISLGDAFNLVIVDEDASLRNNGKEFKTSPSNFEGTIETFKGLHKTLVLGENPFTARTSIHVHVNVRELSLVQTRQLVLLYALFEPLFFEFVGYERKNSIFCVPLNYTYTPSIYKYPISVMKEKWHKYTAFNIIPIGPDPDSPGFGTIEFRHMYGTNNVDIFHIWLSAIRELYLSVATNPTFNTIKEMEKGIVELAHRAIPTLATRHSAEYIKQICADTILDVKLSKGGIK